MESTISDNHEDNFINPNCGLNSSNSINDNVSNITSNLEKKIKCQIPHVQFKFDQYYNI